MKLFLSAFAVSVIVSVGCSSQNKPSEQAPGVSTEPKTGKDMKELVSIVEIPVADFQRAAAFYQAVLNVTIEEVDMAGTHIGVLSRDGKSANVVLAAGSDYKPSSEGALVYLDAGNDLQPTLDKIRQHGGTVFVPKTEISPEMGFFALFTDTEGNKVGLHSPH